MPRAVGKSFTTSNRKREEPVTIVDSTPQPVTLSVSIDKPVLYEEIIVPEYTEFQQRVDNMTRGLRLAKIVAKTFPDY